MLRSLSLLLPLAAASAATIKHVIVLMEENRSFDHFLGHREFVVEESPASL